MIKHEINIGKIIERVVRERTTISSFARQLGLNDNRQRVYNIFKNDSIDTKLLAKISELLNYNFFREYFQEEPTNRKIFLIESDSLKIDEIITLLTHNNSLVINKLKTTV